MASRASSSSHHLWDDVPEVIWKQIWSFDTLPKIRSFLWRVCADGVATASALNHRRIPVENICHWCGASRRDELSCSAELRLRKMRLYLWSARNDLLFNKKAWTPNEVLLAASAACMEFLKARRSSQAPPRPARPLSDQIWRCPPSGKVKLNGHASLCKERNKCGIGFLIRDHLGRCIVAVSDPVPFSKVVVGEAIAIQQGLLEAISEGTLSIIVESDSLEVITALLSRGGTSALSIRPMVEDILHLASYFDECSF
ncbi:uncharacterized protein LOC122664553 [Telopea speciosissima]|uniref:uncharacterized protein LOC122664553 n=1 Tax=Telopea speciosissima TaxID=54955 RepID=UPI001CC5BBE2|nr:uncharacterized protein LOC122664553 [Telopea speciosissima]